MGSFFVVPSSGAARTYMPNDNGYVIICAPAGSGLGTSIERLRKTIANVETQDVEKRLCESPEAKKALAAVGVSRPDADPGPPEMDDITWSLARSQVVSLWEQAVHDALAKLSEPGKSV